MLPWFFYHLNKQLNHCVILLTLCPLISFFFNFKHVIVVCLFCKNKYSTFWLSCWLLQKEIKFEMIGLCLLSTNIQFLYTSMICIITCIPIKIKYLPVSTYVRALAVKEWSGKPSKMKVEITSMVLILCFAKYFIFFCKIRFRQNYV